MACSEIPGNYTVECPARYERVLSIDACSSVEPRSLPFKAISIKQPFAGLIAYGQKTLEIRTWSTAYRGRLLICASRTVYPGKVLLPGKEGSESFTMWAKEYWNQTWVLTEPKFDPFRLAVAVCTVDLVNVRPMVKEDELAARHPFVEGAFVWELKYPNRIAPVEVTGKLGLFEVELPEIEYIID